MRPIRRTLEERVIITSLVINSIGLSYCAYLLLK
jgi:hypothetical protein